MILYNSFFSLSSPLRYRHEGCLDIEKKNPVEVFLALVKRDLKVKLAVNQSMMIGFHYGHGLMKILFICHHPPGVSLKLWLGCYKHVLVLFTKKNQYNKDVLTLKLTHVIVLHDKPVKLHLPPNSRRMV